MNVLRKPVLLFCPDPVRSQFLQMLLHLPNVVSVPDDVDGLDPELLGDLDDCLAHGAVGAVLDDHVARLEGHEVVQHLVGGGGVGAERGGHLQGHITGHL